MSKCYALAMCVTVFLGGCATVTQSQPMAVNPLSANGGQWSLSATSATGVFDDDITLLVNGGQVAKGTLSASDHKGIHITGDYQHHIVLGICSRTDGDPLIYTCDMYVDGSALGTLRWQE